MPKKKIAKPKDNKPLINSLSRCAFLLDRIHNGDHHALENAPDAVAEAIKVLETFGEIVEWREEEENDD